MSKSVNVAIIGVGNCASSFVQGVQYYKDASADDFIPGLMHTVLGGYHVKDINFTAAIDIDARKVGLDLADAVFTEPNNTIKFSDVPKTGITVSRGMTHDGLGKYLSEVIEKAPGETADIVGLLKDTNTDVVVSYLPVGSEQATKWYVEQILQAGCGFVNCVPVFIGREHYWQERFREAGVPIVGDDIKSQVGATIVHRQLTRLMRERGVRLSGGQHQRIGIARALYKQANLLIFDEATSALDNLTESSVMDGLEKLDRNLTVLLIAHRLTTVRHCDTIVELENGKIVGQGTYEELFERSAHFRNMAGRAS